MWNRKKKTKVKELRASVDTASTQLKNQKQKVNAISGWLENRKDQNGFGSDFEYTLRPRRVR